MRYPVHLALILCLALTGIALGAARGTVVRAEQVVLCIGHGVVIVDHPDGPPQAQLCPDMALSLLSAVPDAPGGPALPQGVGTPGRPIPTFPAQGHEAPRPAARDPPFRQFSEPKPV